MLYVHRRRKSRSGSFHGTCTPHADQCRAHNVQPRCTTQPAQRPSCPNAFDMHSSVATSSCQADCAAIRCANSVAPTPCFASAALLMTRKFAENVAHRPHRTISSKCAPPPNRRRRRARPGGVTTVFCHWGLAPPPPTESFRGSPKGRSPGTPSTLTGRRSSPPPILLACRTSSSPGCPIDEVPIRPVPLGIHAGPGTAPLSKEVDRVVESRGGHSPTSALL